MLTAKPDYGYELPAGDLPTFSLSQLPAGTTVDVINLVPRSAVFNLYAKLYLDDSERSRVDLDVTVSTTVSLKEPERVQPPERQKCERRLARISAHFHDFARSIGFELRQNPVPYIVNEGEIYSSVHYRRVLTAHDGPVVNQILARFSSHYIKFTQRPELLAFICHASEDKAFVERLCDFLDRSDIAVWYDRREIGVGDSIVEMVNAGLAEATHVVVVISPNSAQKSWVTRELSSTLMRQLAGSNIKLLPVLAANCALPPLLADIKYANCAADEHRGFEDLTTALL